MHHTSTDSRPLAAQDKVGQQIKDLTLPALSKRTFDLYAWHSSLTACSILGHSLKGRQLVDWAQV